jgi:hypothetical protein
VHAVSVQAEQPVGQFGLQTKFPLSFWLRLKPVVQVEHWPLEQVAQPIGHLTHWLFSNWNPSAQLRQILMFLGSQLPLQLPKHLTQVPSAFRDAPGAQVKQILLFVEEH